MSEKPRLTQEMHRAQIEAYTKLFSCYRVYAGILERVLRNACKVSFPDALVQSRPKSVSSFAEKAARKFGKYQDAVNQLTDLCGARVVVQTTGQVKAVRQFIEANFIIVESDDKGLLLSADKFGYRDMHYIVQLAPARDAALGITAEERAQIGERRAEIQVRTWVQHAWADTLHDRMYKNKLKISSDVVRTGNLLAALMEEGDLKFNQLADDLDGLIANYTAVATRQEVQEEIGIQELILGNEPATEKRPGLALKLARLLAVAGDHARVVEVLVPHADVRDANRCELLMELGYSLCRSQRTTVSSASYQRGCRLLEEALEVCRCTEMPFVPHLRNRESLHARTLVRLGWALEPVSGKEHQARECYHQAHEHEPDNPYYLAAMLGFEMFCARTTDLPAAIRTTIRQAIRTCRAHALAGIELPSAFLTAGRLSLLLEDCNDALGYFARGIRYCLEDKYCVPSDVFAVEMEWLKRIHFGSRLPASYQRILDLLAIAESVRDGNVPSGAKSLVSAPVLIIAGGADTMDGGSIARIRPLLQTGLANHQGAVISGGTTAGVPGCVGDVTGELAKTKKKQFRLLGYRPAKLPSHVAAHSQYDQSVEVGEDFSPDQILRYWTDILAGGIRPREVLMLGLGGGPRVSMVEYQIALGLGVSVGLVMNTGGTAEELLADSLWSGLPNLFPLPFDASTIRAFIIPSAHAFTPAVQEEMARSFHARYVGSSLDRLPANMRPWPELDPTFKKANAEEAKYSIEILAAASFGVRPTETPVIFTGFTDADIEHMAEMEHGRWNVERLRDGWRYGARDDARKIHNCLVPWSDLTDELKGHDRDAVCAFPEILAKAGLEVYRL